MATCPDVAPECATTDIPPHRHVVRLNLNHYELGASYGLRERMQFSLRLPYDIKDQHVHYTTLAGAPYTPPYGDIHHRTETLTGVSDPSMSIEWSPQSSWLLGFGTTLPFGHIVPDPIVLGREGKKHEHLQFGSGTFEPRLSAQWVHRSSTLSWIASGEAKLSLYENREGYRGPTTLIWSAGPSIRAGRFSIDPRLDGQYQTLGRWSGEVDEGSGFNAGGIRLGISLPPVGSLLIAPGVYRELWSHGQDGQTFHQGTTWSLSLTRTF